MAFSRDRRAVLAGLVSALSLGAGAWWWWREEEPRKQESADPLVELTAQTLQQILPYLQLDDAGLARFARDLRTAGQYHVLRRARSGDSKAREWLGQQFLLSSDFFWHEAEESRTIGYRSYYDPYVHPCANPFAHPV